jgi:serine protease AprX
MKKAKRSFKQLVAVAVVFWCVAGVLLDKVVAQSAQPIIEYGQEYDSSSKLSPDLQEIIRDGGERFFAETHSSDLVPIIIRTAERPKRKFLQLLSQRGIISGLYESVSAVSAQLPVGVITELVSRRDVDYISFDRPIKVMGHVETTTGADQVRGYGTKATGGIDGSDIGIAVLDSGINRGHKSIAGRVFADVDFTREGSGDDYGHGTFVASVAAGDDSIAHGAYTGIAPKAKIINVKVLNSKGEGSTSSAIAGIDWCIKNKSKYNIRVMNLSFGTVAVDSYRNDPLCQAVRRAVNAGIVVCVAAGNAGKDEKGNKVYGTIHSPGIEPSAITVGAANTFGTDVRTDDVIASYSSRGPTRGYYRDASGVKHYDNLIKPDIVAPGNRIIDAEADRCNLVKQYPQMDAKVSSNSNARMMYMSGTSVATPVVAGAAALILERNPSLTPNLVKAVLEYTAQPLVGFNTFEQGAGEVNIEGAVRLAGSIRTDLLNLSIGAPLLVGMTPLPMTTIAGASFLWGRGIIQKWNFIYGSTLVSRYQGIYGVGVVLVDGVVLSNGSLLADRNLLSEGVLLSAGVLLANGSLLAEGTLVADGVSLADGVTLCDGSLMSDGVVLSDSVLPKTTEQGVLPNGDLTASMIAVVDTQP